MAGRRYPPPVRCAGERVEGNRPRRDGRHHREHGVGEGGGEAGDPPPHHRPGRTETALHRAEGRPVGGGCVPVSADAQALGARPESHPQPDRRPCRSAPHPRRPDRPAVAGHPRSATPPTGEDPAEHHGRPDRDAAADPARQPGRGPLPDRRRHDEDLAAAVRHRHGRRRQGLHRGPDRLRRRSPRPAPGRAVDRRVRRTARQRAGPGRSCARSPTTPPGAASTPRPTGSARTTSARSSGNAAGPGGRRCCVRRRSAPCTG